jgi:hypothetical protein
MVCIDREERHFLRGTTWTKCMGNGFDGEAPEGASQWFIETADIA